MQNYWKNIWFRDYAVEQNGNDMYEKFKAPTEGGKINKDRGKRVFEWSASRCAYKRNIILNVYVSTTTLLLKVIT